ncbi:MAG: sodium:solute symporter family protein [Planctomycetota bacterium]
MTLVPLYVICAYMVLLLGLGVISSRFFRGTSADYFVASRSIGPFLLLMSVFGTTMTAFALVGSTGKSYQLGVGVYGLMASSSGLVHSLVFFVVGIRLWAIGKRYGYVTQIGFFRDRFQSNFLGYLLFPILVGLVVPYLLIGIIGAGVTVRSVTVGMFPEVFPGTTLPSGRVLFAGAVPPWITGLVVSGVVLFYIFLGGVRGAAWANAMQTIVFMVMGVVAFFLISKALGGLKAASEAVLQNSPEHVGRDLISKPQFISYMLIPLSVGMFPHLFQHWLTARSAKTFKLTVVAHPLFIMIVWVPCVLLGVWAVGQGIEAPGGKVNAILGQMVKEVLDSPVLTGLITAGILAAIMSSLDSQFVCMGTIFTNDVVINALGRERFTDKQIMWLGRGFVVFIVIVTYLLSLLEPPNIFDLAVWCFTGFASLFPLVFAAIYWRRATKAGAIASVLVMVAVWFTFFYQDIIAPAEGAHGEFLVLGMMPVAVIFAASAVTLVVVSLVTKPPAADHVDRFFLEARNA